jgi:outer membrane protein assembly factor BamB
MKRHVLRISTVLFLLIFISAGAACFLKKKPLIYPRGPFFPLQIKIKLNFSGSPLKYLAQAGNHLFWTTSEGELLAYNTITRKIIWRFSFPPSTFSLVRLFENYLYWGDGEGQIRCFTLAGNQVWQTGLRKKLTSPLAVSKKLICVVVEDNKLFGFDREKGQILWKYDSPEKIIAGPALGQNWIVFGGEKGTLFKLDLSGRLRFYLPLGERLTSAVLIEQERCYFSTRSNNFYAFDLRKNKIIWQINLGGESLTSPLSWENKLVVPLWSGVLFCLRKKSGEIQWWQPLPARSDFRPARAEEQILVTSRSSSLVSFELKGGKLKATYDVGYNLKSNPVWLAPYIYLLAYNDQSGEYFLLELAKEVKVVLKAEPTSPRFPGEEIKFIAEATGFYQPKFEFYLGRETAQDKQQMKVERPFSAENSWVWYPEEPGTYLIRVKVKDIMEEAQAELKYIIQEKKKKTPPAEQESIKQVKRD